MLNDIQTFAKGSIPLRSVMFLLGEKYPAKTFDSRVVTNALQTVKRRLASSGSTDAADLCELLQQKQREDSNWFIKIELDDSARLQRLFWMSPAQRILYRRYRDVVLNDNIAKTNRFNMPLNVFVVVDTDGRSRVVACALVRGERTEE